MGKEQRSHGNHELEHRIRSIIRWNAAAFGAARRQKDLELGGHIASFQSAATQRRGFQPLLARAQ